MCLIKSGNLFSSVAFPLAVGRVMDRSAQEHEMHRHEHYELLFQRSGSLHCRFKGAEVTLKAGDLMLIKPFVLHQLDVSARSETRYCSFRPQVIDETIPPLEELKEHGSPNRYFVKPYLGLAAKNAAAVVMNISRPERGGITALLDRLGATAEDRSDRGAALVRYGFLALLTAVSELHDEGMKVRTIELGTQQDASRYVAGLRETLNYIHAHIHEPLSLDEMAEMCGTDKHYFCRLFKHETGTTFTNYLNGLRVEKACAMLRNTPDTLQEICFSVGFNKYLCFNRQFRKHTGLAPSEFRRSVRSGAAGMLPRAATA